MSDTRLRHPACGTELAWLDTIRHDDEQALLWFRAMQRESENKKKAMEEAEQLRDLLYQWLSTQEDTEAITADLLNKTSAAIDAAEDENERLREMNEHLADSDSVACLQDAKRWQVIEYQYSCNPYQPFTRAYDIAMGVK